MKPRAAFLCALVAATVAVPTGGCRSARWQPGGSAAVADGGTLRLTLPRGWSFRADAGEKFLATRDGLQVQHLRIETTELLTPQPPPALAAALLASMRNDPHLTGFTLCENTAVTVAGRAGFKLVYSFRNADGLQLIEARYGCLDGPRLVQLCYQAPARHYFQRDLLDVEATVGSLRIAPAKP